MQTSFVIGAIVLFTTLVLVFNQRQNNVLETNLYNEAVIVSTGLGDSFLNELTRKSFDENTVSGSIDDLNELTSPMLLGAESGEINFSQYDDIDDFDGKVIIDSLNKLGVFTTSINVFYVDEATPNIKSNSKKYLKRVDIEITNVYLRNPIKLFYIASY